MSTARGEVNVTCVPPSKSIPKLRPLTPIAPIAIASTTPESANQYFRLPMKSIWIHFAICWPCAPMNCGLSNHLKPERIPSIARVAPTAVTSETAVPMSSISAKPLTLADATRKSTSAVIAVTMLASMIELNPFA